MSQSLIPVADMLGSQRTRALSPSARRPRLQSFRDAIQKAWTNPDFIQGTQTFEGFLRLFALDQVLPYLQSTGADRMEDWSAVPLDDKGRRLLSDMSTQFSNSPLRSTKSMVTVTTERFKPGDCAFLVARELWTDLIPVLVSTSMQLAKNAHTFHNPQSWPGLPANLHPMLQRVLTDRFWQAGISSGSKDDFYAKVSGSRFTLEGFASSVRAKIRSIRECSYSIIFSLSKLGDHFYRHEDLGAPLADALFTNSTTLSSHQFSVLLNIAQCIIRDCPANHMHHFLPPMISLLFTQIDQKLTAEWEKIERLKAGLEQADLAEEMKDESVLRQLTYTAVLFVANCFDPNKPVARLSPAQVTGTVPYEPTLTMRRFIISSPQILEPMLVFCTHVLQMKDTRCCGVICQVLRSVLDEFRPEPDTPTAASIREYISTEILKAAITSMHDPYFVDLQKDLAQLVASIWIQYGPLTSTPRSVIASLPSIDEKRVLQTESQLANTKSSRRQKALVLDLLENVRGVSVAEQGRITTREERRKQLSAFQAQYMKVEMEAQDGPHGPGGDDGPDLTGVAELLGEAS
ncbi:hypothetical protein KEM52_002527 [Ascosphaera acerosa]|nr:hypothetical protein KEM52_002527 [Ascosphaera acerosa]